VTQGDTVQLARQFEAEVEEVVAEWDAAQRPFAQRLGRLEEAYRGVLGEVRVEYLVRECLDKKRSGGGGEAEEGEGEEEMMPRKPSVASSSTMWTAWSGSEPVADRDEDGATVMAEGRGTDGLGRVEWLLLAKTAEPCLSSSSALDVARCRQSSGGTRLWLDALATSSSSPASPLSAD
jgi:hypothetical protein